VIHTLCAVLASETIQTASYGLECHSGQGRIQRGVLGVKKSPFLAKPFQFARVF